MRASCVRLTSALESWLATTVPRSKGYLKTHVVSRGLCDESLDLIQETLPKPHTCDIIDINPGVCVWSQAIHERLQPRRHILVEPERNLYGEWLDPLLQQSSYRYAPRLSTALNLDDELLSPDAAVAAEKTRDAVAERGFKNIPRAETLLITANLTNKAIHIPGFVGTEAKQFLSEYYRSLFSTTQYIHRYGLVRLLAWIDENTRKIALPTSVIAQTKQSVQLESAFDITLLNSSSNYINQDLYMRRWHMLDNENLETVLHTQAESGRAVHSNREPQPAAPPIGYIQPTTDILRENRALFPESAFFIEELLSTEEKLEALHPGWIKRYRKERSAQEKLGVIKGRIPPAIRASKILGPDEKLFRRLISQLRNYHNNYIKIRDVILEYRELFHKIISAYRKLLPNSNTQSEEVQNLLASHAELRSKTKGFKKDNRRLVEKAIDDYRSHDAKPATMAWNRRTFEPLMSSKSEFWPDNRRMALLDFQPRPEFLEHLDTLDKQICFDYVVSSFSMHSGDNLIQAIKRIVPAGHEIFLKGIDGLKDPSRGGWHDWEDLRIRTLDRGVQLKIALAFEQWPHRPPIERLMIMQKTVFDKPIGMLQFH